MVQGSLALDTVPLILSVPLPLLMAIHTLRSSQILRATPQQCWDFFSDPRNLSKITPPDMGFIVKSKLPPRIHAGMMIEYRVSPLLGIPMTWLTEITQVREGEYFVDEQRVGPYAIWHKVNADRIFEQTLHDRGIQYRRYMTNPTIFNNIVWYGVAEGDTAFYCGLYGFRDRTERYVPISVLPKSHHLLDGIPADDRAYAFLRWFSNDYYNVVPYNGDTLQVNDLRFGLLGDTILDKNYVFPFLLFKNEKGEWDTKQNNRNRSSVKGSEDSFAKLWERIVEGRD